MSITGTGTEAQQRADYIKGLRALADVLERDPSVRMPHTGASSLSPLHFMFLRGDDPRAEMAATARAIPCSWQKKVTDDGESANFYLNGRLHGLELKLIAYRDAVCERIVTGTEERPVEEIVQPAVIKTVMKTVEIVEWRCGSVLAPAAQPESSVTA